MIDPSGSRSADDGARRRETWYRRGGGGRACRARSLLSHRGHVIAPIALESTLQQVGERERRELLARVAERTHERVVRMLEGAVGAGDENEIPGLLGRGGQQPHARAGALQLATLCGQPQRQQPQACDRHHAGQQRAKRIIGDSRSAEGRVLRTP